MIARPVAALLAAGLAVAACQQGEPNAPTPTPTPTATVTVPVPVPVQVVDTGTPSAIHTKGVAPEPDPELCGADKLGPYLNLLPTSTAKDEIAKTVGHNRIRYVGPDDVITQEFRADRLTAELGVDGRIKRFRCG